MDNLTHTLIGALIGETVARTTAADPKIGLPEQVRRNLLVTFGAVGSNLPDIDLAYSFIGGKINYLLQHRGHSHTIVGALILAGLMLFLTKLWLRRRALKPSRTDRVALIGVALLTPLLHIGMDFTNNYGVHPFWPFYNGWIYGDAVFIAEPLLWAACAPLVFTLRTRTSRTLVAVLLAAGVALTLLIDLVPRATAITFMVALAGMLLIGYRAQPRTAVLTGVGLWIGVTLTFVVASHVAGREVDELAARNFRSARLLDRVLTPVPANPFCWQIQLVQEEHEGIALRRAMLSLAPSWIRAERCLATSSVSAANALSTGSSPSPPEPTSLRPTAPLRRLALPNDDSVQWSDEIITPRNELVTLVRNNCQVSAALRFMRMPWYATVKGEQVLGDLRYDREPELGFAEIEVQDRPESCPRFVPPWVPPRSDVIGVID